jgi:hypothetical protein
MGPLRLKPSPEVAEQCTIDAIRALVDPQQRLEALMYIKVDIHDFDHSAADEASFFDGVWTIFACGHMERADDETR